MPWTRRSGPKCRPLLEVDPKLAAECARLEQTIAPLADDEAWIEPPARLAERTISFVEATAETHPPRDSSAEEGHSDAVQHRRFSSLEELLVDEPPHQAHFASLSPVSQTEIVRSRRWTLADAIVATGICIAAAMLFIPAIAHSQRQAAITQCQNKLYELGTALVSYSRDHQGQFPLVPARGNLGVAGIYAPLLKESGRVKDDQAFLCPGSTLAENANDFRVPSTAELERQSGKTLEASQRTMGGSFGYAFGYEDEDKGYQANENRSRERFAIIGDAPSLHLKDRQSANHGGRGQNVLFEDLHVDYLHHCRADEATDNVYLSDRGYVEAGRHWNDAVIGNSWARPVLPRRN